MSYTRHCKQLQNEFKSRPNAQVVEELTEISFAMRRKDIADNACDLKSLLTLYPPMTP